MWYSPERPPKTRADFGEWQGSISIEAEHFTRTNPEQGFRWQTIVGLGKTGDSVAVFPQRAHTFENFSRSSPSLEYTFHVSNSGEFSGRFYLIPTQPLIAGTGLRFVVAVDNEEPRTITVGKGTEVSSPEWAKSILDQATIGQTTFDLKKGDHILKIFAVETGIVLDKIVLSSRELPVSYFGPAETRFARSKK
jgi:hypothetical protein